MSRRSLRCCVLCLRSSRTCFNARTLDLENRALRLYVRAATDADPTALTTAARLGLGTEFFLYPLGCATAQLDALRASGASLPPRAAAHVTRCSGLRATRDIPH